MSETERDAVLWEFYRPCPACEDTGGGVDHERMADEIVRLRQRTERAERILAALRAPSKEMVDALENSCCHSSFNAAISVAEWEAGA